MKTTLSNINQERTTDYWNIVKGIGIIAVVIGHTSGPLVNFAYLFHLAIFFFVSGYFYKQKYTFSTFIKKKIKSLWLPFFLYNTIFILIHNFLIGKNTIQEPYYSYHEILDNIFKAALFIYNPWCINI